MKSLVPADDYIDFDEFIKARPPGEDIILMGMATDGIEVGMSTWKESPSPNMIVQDGTPVIKTMVYHCLARPGFSYLVITNRPDEWTKCRNVLISYRDNADELILQFANYIRNRRDREVILLVLDQLDEVLEDLDFDAKQYLSQIIREGQRYNVFAVTNGHSEWDNRFGMTVFSNINQKNWYIRGSEQIVFYPLRCNL